LGERFVCARCFSDYALAQFATDNATEMHCDYCGRRSKRKPIAVPIDDVLAEISKGIRSEWGNPEGEGVPYETQEGGWQGEVIDSYDLFHDEIDDPFDNDDLRQDVIDAFFDNAWCQKHFWSLKPAQALQYSWEKFVDVVKHQVRYLFSVVRDDDEDHEVIAPSAFLERVGELISEIGLVRDLRKGTKLFRARVHRSDKRYRFASELGTPPVPSARFSNRMSPAGIPMFYGAFDAETAIAETFDPQISGEKVVTVGCFESARDFPVLDLTNVPKVPSIFDSERRHLRPGLTFLRGFVYDLKKPIVKDGLEHIEYVPTQIFTEYIRRIYNHPLLGHPKGILYESVRKQKGTCCVLFFLSEDCCDIHAGWTNELEEYSKHEHKWWLGLAPERISEVSRPKEARGIQWATL
jgi:hypothetical protein